MSSILAAGMLKHKSRRGRDRASRYTITCLDEQHLPIVMDLQEVIVQNLGRPDLLQSFSYDFMKRHMGRQGAILGLFVENRLVAFRNFYYPDPDDKEWNLGLDLQLADEELTKVVNLQMVCVHPRFRGNGLALKMNRVALGLLRERGVHYHVCATVSPYNIWNIPILLASGFRIAMLKNKYGGKVRYIAYQNLRNCLKLNDQSAVHVRLEDLDTQKKWFSSGFYGAALYRREDYHPENPEAGFDLVFHAPAEYYAAPFELSTPCFETVFHCNAAEASFFMHP